MKIELKFLDEVNPTELAMHANDINVNQYLRNSFPYPYTLDNALSFINYSSQHNDLNFGIVVDGICVGCVSGTFHKDIYAYNCEIGYWISSLYWNKGILSQVVKVMCEYIFTHYSIHKITAEVFIDNLASCHVLEKNGFIKEGWLKEHAYKNGRYYDVILYALRREDL